jgi:hypothetical protein
MGKVIKITDRIADVYEVWFRETLHEQADAFYANISFNRAKEIAEKNIGSRKFRCAQMIGYKNDKKVYEKVLGHINGKLTWIDPW